MLLFALYCLQHYYERLCHPALSRTTSPEWSFDVMWLIVLVAHSLCLDFRTQPWPCPGLCPIIVFTWLIASTVLYTVHTKIMSWHHCKGSIQRRSLWCWKKPSPSTTTPNSWYAVFSFSKISCEWWSEVVQFVSTQLFKAEQFRKKTFSCKALPMTQALAQW